MKVESSQFCIQLKRLSTYLTLLMCFSIQLVKADIGETFALKKERSQFISEIRLLQNDSISERISELLDSLQLRVSALDEKIFTSYDESISRLANQNLTRSKNDKRAIYLALITSIAALFFALLLLMARSRIQSNANSGLLEMYGQLAMDFFGKVSAEKASKQGLLRVNVVVLIGLVMMGLSILAYLLSRL